MKKPTCETNRDVIQHIDPTKKVRVYRNLHRKCISVKQGRIVRCWTTNVVLKDCKFIISKAGQRRVRDEKKKNVHAFIEGYVADTRKADKYVDGEWSDKEIENGFTNWICAYYNPYECDGFMNTATEQVYETAKIADLSNLDKVIYVFAPLTSSECMV